MSLAPFDPLPLLRLWNTRHADNVTNREQLRRWLLQDTTQRASYAYQLELYTPEDVEFAIDCMMEAGIGNLEEPHQRVCCLAVPAGHPLASQKTTRKPPTKNTRKPTPKGKRHGR